MMGEKNCDIISTLIMAKKNLRKAGLVTKIRNCNSIISPYLFNFQLYKDLHIDTIGPKLSPTKKKVVIQQQNCSFHISNYISGMSYLHIPHQ